MQDFPLKIVRQCCKIMKYRNWFVFFTIHMICFILHTTHTFATTIEAASCSLAHVQTAVSSAGRGDTVIVPAGSCKWAGTLSITKAIILQGAGAGRTIITSNFIPSTKVDGMGSGESLIFFKSSNIASDTNTNLRITGFTFDLNHKTSGILINNFSTTPLNKLRIDNNTFLNCYYGGTTSFNWYSTIMTYGTVYGVIHSNTFSSGVPHLTLWGGMTIHGIAELTNMGVQIISSLKTMILQQKLILVLFLTSEQASVVYRYNTFRLKFDAYTGVFSIHGNVGAQNVYAAMGEHYGNRIISDYSNTIQTFELVVVCP